jgi:two-component system chemotaxis sensor kinase CheA
MSEIDETIKEFLVESFENLEQLDHALLDLESDPLNLDTINKIFRIVHTIKGTCGFFDFKKLEKVSHVGENLLDSLRSERVYVKKETITGLLHLNDILKELLTNIEQSGNEGDGDYSNLIEVLNALNNPSMAVVNKEDNVSVISDTNLETPSASILESANTKHLARTSESVNKVSALESSDSNSLDDLDRMFAAAQAERDSQLKISSSINNTTASAIETQVTLAEKELPTNKVLTASSQVVSQEPKKSELADSSLRVDVNLLDKLMNLVGELVLARNQILQFTKKLNDGEFSSTSQRLNLITSELQDGVMRTRMQPISTVWNKLPRIVRDMSHACGKQVHLEMQGQETELDKTIIEAIKDPLTHIIRNSVDHGVETPEHREKAGKIREGTLRMHAYHEGGQVIIEISDDGAGLNTERIRAKALEKALVAPDKAASMSEAEIHRLIFLPGFSTAEKITNISGRGVGMDVVRSNIERIGGAVDVASKVGHGSKFTIKIPLTLAIIPGLIVTTKGNRYAIPQVNLLELVRIEGEQLKSAIERIQGSDFYRLRGKILPLVYLDEQLELVPTNDETSSKKSNVISLVVVQADNHQFGLVVDAIHDTEEIVVKPLGRLFKGISTFAGATIMGDGQVALILDIVGLGRKAQITKKDAAIRNQEKLSAEENTRHEKKRMFVFEIGQNRRAAIPLDNVYRLEEFQCEQLELAGGHLVVQYRNGILPLVDLRKVFGANVSDSRENESIRAFVYHSEGQFVGFIVDNIVDIVEQALKVESPHRKAGLVGSGIIQGKVTDLLDLQSIIKSVGLGVEKNSIHSEVA